MPVLARVFRRTWLTAVACLLGATAAVAGPEEKPIPRDQAAPSSLALPARQLVWPSLPKLTLWWQGAQSDTSRPAQAARPGATIPTTATTPTAAERRLAQADPQPAPTAPAAQPAPSSEPAPGTGESPAAAPAPAPAQPGEATVPSDADIVAQAQAELEAGVGETEGEVIVVTGSAIERKETTTPAPVSVVDREEMDASGLVSVGDILQNLPAQSNGINVQVNNGGTGATEVDLRGLGSERTLVLVNGRRHVLGSNVPDAAVDLNAIPLAVIKRVEVLKDGASAVYGSDAIAGVVNIITRDDFQGTEANVYTGTTQRGDGTNIDVSAVTGQRSTRGNVVFAAGYSDQKPIFAGDRDYAENAYNYDFASGEVATSGSVTTPNGSLFLSPADLNANPSVDPGRGGTPLCPTQLDFGCTPDGTSPTGFRDFNQNGASDVGQGDLYNFQPENYLVTPLRRYNVFSTGNYRFHQNVRGFFEASYMNRQSTQRLAPEPLSTGIEGIPFSADSYYNPTGIDLFDVNRRMIENGPRVFTENVDTFRVVAGFDGTLPQQAVEGWKWEASFNFGRTQETDTNDGRLIRSRVANAIGPSFLDPETGQVQCGTPGNVIEGCVPLNLIGGEGTITPEMLDYIGYTGIGDTFVQQRIWSGTVNGPLFKTPWNGDVVLAVGGDFRQEDGADQPDPLTASGDTTGNKQDPTAGGYDVLEGFAELSIVPVTGKDWAKWLEINLAGRQVDYSTFGGHFTWKAGSLWKFKGGLAVRGTYSTAFRAPSIGELYSGQADSFENTSDPCNTSGGATQLDPVVAANCATAINQVTNGTVDPTTFTDGRAQIPSRVGGNPDLQPETANVWTSGLVYEPEFLEGLGMSVDYFDIAIDNALQDATSSVILGNCYSVTNQSDCELITRDPATGRITSVLDTQNNIGTLATAGIDFNVNYEYAFPSAGRFRHNLEGTWLREYSQQFPSRTVDALGVYDLEGVFPRWKVNFTTLWGLKGAGLGFNVRYIAGIRECEDNNCQPSSATAMLDHNVDANFTGDVFGSYAIHSPAGTTTVAVGVNNVTDQNPPVIYNGFLATSDASAYDYMGRFFYARLSQAF